MSKSYGPFRRWLDKMGLISIPPSEEQVPTAELPDHPLSIRPQPDSDGGSQPDAETAADRLTEEEIHVSTADTKPLPPEMAEASPANEIKADEPAMESKSSEPTSAPSEVKTKGSGPLLDLGDFQPARAASEEVFELDLDLDEAPEPVEASSAFQSQRFAPGSLGVESSGGRVGTLQEQSVAEPSFDQAQPEESHSPTVDPMAKTQEMVRPEFEAPVKSEYERTFTEPEILEAETLRMTAPIHETASGGKITLDQLTPEVIDAIARRAVEMLSERTVQEVAWEVVPQLAELMIKRQLEEKSS